MKTINPIFIFILTLCLYTSCASQNTDNDQINAALQAAPEDQRANATVLGYDENGQLVTMKKGTNNLICLADDPYKSGFNAACYHKDLSQFMTRGRELRAEGKTRKEIDEIREAEAKSGDIKMPQNPSTLHILFGKEAKYNPKTGVVDSARLRYVIYVPWATQESTGLPTKPIVPGGPWIMDPGTHKAHIMISPVKN